MLRGSPSITAVAAAETVPREANRTLVVFICMAGTIMQMLDTTIANVAQPHMQGSVGATQDQISWVITSYIVAAAIMTPATGWFAAKVGRNRAFAIAIGGFTIASALCGAATTLPQLVLYRLMQGTFGAAIAPLSQAIMLDAYPRQELAKAMSIFSTGIMVGPILGPIVGGWLTQEYNWRWCFYINVPIGIFVVLGALAFVPATGKMLGRKFDGTGFAFFAIAVGCLQLMLDRGEQKGWFESPEILTEATLAVFGLYMFVVHSLTKRNPFIDMRLFKDVTFISSTSIIFLMFTIFMGATFLLPQMLQLEFNYPVMTAGLITTPRGLGMMVSMIALGRIGNRFNQRLIVLVGMALCGLSLYFMSRWSLTVPMGDIVWTGALQGFGVGLLSMPVSTLAFSTLSLELRNDGSAFFNFMRNMGSAVGVAFISSQLVSLTQINHGHLAEFITPFRHMTMPGLHGEAAMKMMNLELTQQAAMIAYTNGYRMLCILSFAMMPLVFLLRFNKNPPAPSREMSVAYD